MFHVHRDSYTAVSNNTRPTPRTRVGALSQGHPGHRDTPVVPAGHPQYTGAREGRLWVAQAQTQLTLFVDPQSLSLECEHFFFFFFFFFFCFFFE